MVNVFHVWTFKHRFRLTRHVFVIYNLQNVTKNDSLHIKNHIPNSV